MSRSGYTDDFNDNWELWFYRSAVENAIKGRRGQQFLRDLIAALDALPVKRLIEGELESGGEVCALWSIGKMRGLSMEAVDPYDGNQLGKLFGIAPSMALEIMYENDEGPWQKRRTPEDRWAYMRQWAVDHLKVMP